MTYVRTAQQRADDFANARVTEEHVSGFLGQWKIENFDSPDKLDIWIPGAVVEVKEKRQKIGPKWPLPCPEPDAFIVDELTLRKAMAHFPAVFFVLRDRPGDRWFVARLDELLCCDRIRLNRDTGRSLKAKHVFDMTQFRQLAGLDELLPLMFEDQVECGWKQSECVVKKGLVVL